MSRIFITGFPRSGTSLLVRLLADTPERSAFSQPLPLLISDLRRQFLASIGRSEDEQAYPFADDQFENYSAPEAFAEFLTNQCLSSEALRASLQSMREYSGQYFKPADPMASLEGWTGADLAAFADHYFATHGKGASGTRVWKEIAAEPLIAYLAKAGWRSVLILRDPRDAIASMLFGQGHEHAGLPRPLLFMARQWRRTALYGLAEPFGTTAVRYEDVLADPEAALGGAIEAQPILTDALDTRRNSSFGGSENRAALEPGPRRFVEAICFAEMVALGYAPTIDASDIEAVLAEGPGPEVLHRPVLARFAWSAQRHKEELDRLRRLTGPVQAYRADAFLFEAAYARLREVRA